MNSPKQDDARASLTMKLEELHRSPNRTAGVASVEASPVEKHMVSGFPAKLWPREPVSQPEHFTAKPANPENHGVVDLESLFEPANSVPTLELCYNGKPARASAHLLIPDQNPHIDHQDPHESFSVPPVILQKSGSSGSSFRGATAAVQKMRVRSLRETPGPTQSPPGALRRLLHWGASTEFLHALRKKSNKRAASRKDTSRNDFLHPEDNTSSARTSVSSVSASYSDMSSKSRSFKHSGFNSTNVPVTSRMDEGNFVRDGAEGDDDDDDDDGDSLGILETETSISKLTPKHSRSSTWDAGNPQANAKPSQLTEQSSPSPSPSPFPSPITPRSSPNPPQLCPPSPQLSKNPNAAGNSEPLHSNRSLSPPSAIRPSGEESQSTLNDRPVKTGSQTKSVVLLRSQSAIARIGVKLPEAPGEGSIRGSVAADSSMARTRVSILQSSATSLSFEQIVAGRGKSPPTDNTLMKFFFKCREIEGLNKFLALQKRRFLDSSFPDTEKCFHMILSEAGAGLSSMISTICTAWLLENTMASSTSRVWHPIPVMNMGVQEMWNHRDAAWLFHVCGIDADALLFRDEITPSNEAVLSGRVKRAVMGHDILVTKPDEVSSSCTIVSEKFRLEAPKLLQARYTMTLLLAGILVDTRNLSCGSSRDKQQATILLVGAGSLGRNGFYNHLMNIRDEDYVTMFIKEIYGESNALTGEKPAQLATGVETKATVILPDDEKFERPGSGAAPTEDFAQILPSPKKMDSHTQSENRLDDRIQNPLPFKISRALRRLKSRSRLDS